MNTYKIASLMLSHNTGFCVRPQGFGRGGTRVQLDLEVLEEEMCEGEVHARSEGRKERRTCKGAIGGILLDKASTSITLLKHQISSLWLWNVLFFRPGCWSYWTVAKTSTREPTPDHQYRCRSMSYCQPCTVLASECTTPMSPHLWSETKTHTLQTLPTNSI